MLGVLLLGLAIALFSQKRYYSSLVLFFGFVTQGFLVIPPAVLLAGAPVEKTTDLAIVYVLAVVVLRFTTIRQIMRNESLFRWVLIFLLFVVCDAFYSYQILGYDLGSVIKIFRHYLIFLSFGVLIMVPLPVLTRVLHTLAVITVLQSVLFLLQIPTGTILLAASSNVHVNNMEHIGWVRYYNNPPYLAPVLFYFLFVYRYPVRWLHWLVVGILLATVVAPMHRSYMLIVVLVVSAYVLSRQSFANRALYAAILVLLVYGAMSVGAVRTRVDEGVRDITNTFANNRSLASVDYDVSDTFGYRMAHLFERINYVVQSPGTVLFGIGLLPEETRQAEKLPFEAGIYNDRIGRITQIETGDIAWSIVILHLGFAGMSLLVAMTAQFLKLFYHCRNLPVSVVGLLTLATNLLISFTGVELIQLPFRVLLMLLLVLVVKTNRLARMPTIESAASPDAGQPQPIIQLNPA